MDDLFLRVLKAYPEDAPGLFIRLFAMRDKTAMIRFLSDNPSWLDCLQIAFALPSGLFLRELWKELLSTKKLRSQKV